LKSKIKAIRNSGNYTFLGTRGVGKVGAECLGIKVSLSAHAFDGQGHGCKIEKQAVPAAGCGVPAQRTLSIKGELENARLTEEVRVGGKPMQKFAPLS